MSAWGTSWDKVVKPTQEQVEEVKNWPEEKLADAAITIIGTVWPIPKEGHINIAENDKILKSQSASTKWPDATTGKAIAERQASAGVIDWPIPIEIISNTKNLVEAYIQVRNNKVPTHDPYTNPGAYLYYECKCGQILAPKVKSFAALNNAASMAGWKIRFGHEYYIPYCIECGKGID